MPDENQKLYCLEAVADVASNTNSELFPMLEHLAFEQQIANIYQSCDSISGFEQSLNDLLYEDRNFEDYELIYLSVPGSGSDIAIDGYNYSLEEIAELFEGKLKGKLVHFSNAKILDIDLGTAQYFIDVTRAKAVSGYSIPSPFASHFLDSKLIAHYYHDTDSPVELVRLLLQNHGALCGALGFKLFY